MASVLASRGPTEPRWRCTHRPHNFSLRSMYNRESAQMIRRTTPTIQESSLPRFNAPKGLYTIYFDRPQPFSLLTLLSCGMKKQTSLRLSKCGRTRRRTILWSFTSAETQDCTATAQRSRAIPPYECDNGLAYRMDDAGTAKYLLHAKATPRACHVTATKLHECCTTTPLLRAFRIALPHSLVAASCLPIITASLLTGFDLPELGTLLSRAVCVCVS